MTETDSSTPASSLRSQSTTCTAASVRHANAGAPSAMSPCEEQGKIGLETQSENVCGPWATLKPKISTRQTPVAGSCTTTCSRLLR